MMESVSESASSRASSSSWVASGRFLPSCRMKPGAQPSRATPAIVHQASPDMPCAWPTPSIRPEMVGPNPRQMLADDAAAPFKVPRTRFEGEELAKMMASDGYERDWNVTLPIRRTIKPGMRSFSGRSAR
jgi:hypothetical protein